MRPLDSVSGTRCTRWTPLSYFRRGEHVPAGDRRLDLLDAADPGVAGLDRFHRPAALLGIALVHPGTDLRRTGPPRRRRCRRGFPGWRSWRPPRPSATAAVAGASPCPDAGLQFEKLGLRHLLHFGVGFGIADQFGQVGHFCLGRLEGPDTCDDRLHFGIFLGQAREFPGVAGCARGHLRFDFPIAGEDGVETGGKGSSVGFPDAGAGGRTSPAAPATGKEQVRPPGYRGTPGFARRWRGSRTVAPPAASSSAPISTAARAPIRSARFMRFFRLPPNAISTR